MYDWSLTLFSTKREGLTSEFGIKERGPMKLKTMVVLVLFALVVLTMLQNTHVVVVHFLFWRFALSQIVLIVLILLAGFVLGYLFARMPKHRH